MLNYLNSITMRNISDYINEARVQSGPKYVLGEETRKGGKTFVQVVAARDIRPAGGEEHIRKGDIGGWIESEANLSQDGECWICPGVYVSGNSAISGDALVQAEKGEISISGDCSVFGNALVLGDGIDLSGSVIVGKNAMICSLAIGAKKAITIGGHITINDIARVEYTGKGRGRGIQISGTGEISGAAAVAGENIEIGLSAGKITDGAGIGSNVNIGGSVLIQDNAYISGGEDRTVVFNSTVYGKALITGGSWVEHSEVGGDVRLDGEEVKRQKLK